MIMFKSYCTPEVVAEVALLVDGDVPMMQETKASLVKAMITV